jgi:hypothetical protein
MVVISTEGTVTEPQYFNLFNNDTTVLHVKIIKNKGSGPAKVLQEMKRYLDGESLRKNDQAWLVVDKDQWTDTQLQALHAWNKTNPQYGLAVSNPKFEYWLLLHFEDGNGIQSIRDCSIRLDRYLPDYRKSIQADKLLPNLKAAIRRAEQKDQPPCTDWPHVTGTTVYRLVQELIKSQNV